MRSMIGFTLAVGVFFAACDGAATSPSESPGAARFSAANNPATVTAISHRYLIEGESFSFCSGEIAWADITWHETDVYVTTPNGATRIITHLNMVEGQQVIGADGTVYNAQQVNSEQTLESPGGGFDFLKQQIKIMLVSRGSGTNTFHYIGPNWVETTDCRGV